MSRMIVWISFNDTFRLCLITPLYKSGPSDSVTIYRYLLLEYIQVKAVVQGQEVVFVGVPVLVDVVQKKYFLDGLVKECLVVLDPLDAHQFPLRNVLALMNSL